MNFDFPKPNSQSLKTYIPSKLIEVASKLPASQISLPTVDKILQAIQTGDLDKITNLEWIYCLHAKAKWDIQNPQSSYQTSKIIWAIAINNSWLQKQLLWRLALYYNAHAEKVLAKSLADSFDTFVNSPLTNKSLPVQVILALRTQQPGLELAKIACQKNLNYTSLQNHIHYHIPTWIEKLNFLKYVSPYFCTLVSPTEQQTNWLLNCLDEMSAQQQLEAVNHLLTHVSSYLASQHPQLVDWLRRNYRNGAGWNLLSDTAKHRLREWIGAVNYGDFQELVDLILAKIHFEKWEANQLVRRREFWADYSNCFEQIRILLPQTSQKVIGSELKRNVDILENDGSEQTEICIFDFGDWLVVEFFRGIGSETRLFPNNHENQQLLFGSSKLSVKQIRAMGGEKHDHKYLWQVFCREWLLSKNISPNTANKTIKNPTPHELHQRNIKLTRWQNDIERLEQEALHFLQ